MTFSYSLAFGTDRDYIRLLITDVDTASHVFEDEEIDAFYARNGSSVLLGAATALEVIASNEALVSKRIKILDLTTDGPAVAEALMARAKALREQAVSGAEAEPAFAVAEFIGNPWGLAEHIWRGYGIEP